MADLCVLNMDGSGINADESLNTLVVEGHLSIVPFSEAVERMRGAVPDNWTWYAPEVMRPILARMLWAAVGEGR
jgi:hypothetical protein